MGMLAAEVMKLGFLLTMVGFGVWVGSASVAAWQGGRRAYAAEIDSTYFQLGVRRFSEPAPMSLNL